MSQSNNQIYPYKNQVYEHLKRQHNSNNLFVDPEFQANNSSLYYTQAPPKNCTWRRPSEICSDPHFIINEASRFDLDQGYLGNCWFIAAVSMITQRPIIFQHVVPKDQGFGSDYAGIFHFRFWQFGKWYDVVIDDYLPVFPDGRLVFCRFVLITDISQIILFAQPNFNSNKTERNEFWSCLLEKAYAKLSWSYEGLDAGQTTDALIDMTGGIEETYDLKELRDKGSFFEVIGNALGHDAMMGASINADPNQKEAKLSNGLVRGHAYAITAVVTLNVNGQYVRLVRLRNPWGNEVEWNGRWSDRDPGWNQIPAHDRQQLGQASRADGEFWMAYEDWAANFDQIQICNLSPDTLKAVKGTQGIKWNSIQFDGELVPGRSAGGCGQPDKQKFWINPQYLVRLDHPDTSSSDCVLIIAFMQKYTRQKRMQNRGDQAEEFLQLRIFRVNDGVDVSVFNNGNGQKLYPKDLERIGTTGPYINKREVTYQCRVPPGNYIIIPSTYEADKEVKFLIRVFTENRAESVPMNIDKPHVDQDDIQFHDGKGEDPEPSVKQWWENLPPEERDRIKKMLGIAAVGTVAICCCFQILSQLMKNDENEEQY